MYSNGKMVTSCRDRCMPVANSGTTMVFMDLSPPWDLLECRLSLEFPVSYQFDNLSWNICLVIAGPYFLRLSFSFPFLKGS